LNRDNLPLITCICSFAFFIINIFMFSYNANWYLIFCYIYMPFFSLFVYKKNEDIWYSLSEKSHNGIKTIFLVFFILSVLFQCYAFYVMLIFGGLILSLQSVFSIMTSISILLIVFLSTKKKIISIMHHVGLICFILSIIFYVLLIPISSSWFFTTINILFFICCGITISFKISEQQKKEIEYNDVNV